MQTIAGNLGNYAESDRGIAIVGIACRFPGADTPREFWANLVSGRESIEDLSEEQLREAGVPEDLWRNPRYVRRAALVNDETGFDAPFFGYAPREARLMDPQHRLFLECAWEALEDAGYDPRGYRGAVGVYGGAGGSITSYLFAHAGALREQLGNTGGLAHLGNDKDFLTTRVSFALNLRGPSLTIQTACSTSLVAVHVACQSLLAGECDLALAGGVTVRVPQGVGYLPDEGGLLSPDGHCRAFDAAAQGTVFGGGVGLVALKPLARAQADGDHIYAVIRGTAVNNDGGHKLSYTASSVDGQVRAMREALTVAGIEPDTVDYIEAHGTATSLGDPVEVQALTRAFMGERVRPTPLWFGSVKTNIGHLEAAAGVAALIKAALCLHHRQLPPSLHFRTPNPRIHFAAAGLEVNSSLRDWPTGRRQRRACVNGLGIGGTNAFVVLEEAPAAETAIVTERPVDLLCLSARTETALAKLAGRYLNKLEANAFAALTDVAFTTRSGRAHFQHRAAIPFRDAGELRRGLAALARGQSSGCFRGEARRPAKVAFVFSGNGPILGEAGCQLALSQSTVRRSLEHCQQSFEAHLSRPLIEIVLALEPDSRTPTEVALASLALQYSLAALWDDWGIQPDLVIGVGRGALAAACWAGALTLPEAAELTVFACQPSANISFAHSGGLAESVQNKSAVARLPDRLDSGSTGNPYGKLAGTLRRPLILGAFGVERHNLTPADWLCAVHLPDARETLQSELGHRGINLLLDIGSDDARGALDLFDGDRGATIRPRTYDWDRLFAALAGLYLRGVPIDGLAFDQDPRPPRRVSLPTYPFEHERYVIEPGVPSAPLAVAPALFEIVWKAQEHAPSPAAGGNPWLVIGETDGEGLRLAEALGERGRKAVLLDRTLAETWSRALVEHTWEGVVLLSGSPEGAETGQDWEGSLYEGCREVLELVQMMDRGGVSGRLWLVTRGTQAVGAEQPGVRLAHAPIWGFGKVLAWEHPRVGGRLVDLEGTPHPGDAAWLADELLTDDGEEQRALRQGRRYVARLAKAKTGPAVPVQIRANATYVVTGGGGGLGRLVTRWLVGLGATSVVLCGRRPPDETAAHELKELRATGAGIEFIQADVTQANDVARLFAHLDQNLPPLAGVIHAAGVLDDGILANQTWPRFESVLGPKVRGAWLLHQHTCDRQLDFFVLFSSIASFLGAPGQGTYAAGNAFLDALASHRHSLGLPALTINWGPWAEVGMAVSIPLREQQRWTDRGVSRLSVDQGCAMLGSLLGSRARQVGVLSVDWDRFVAALPTGRDRRLYAFVATEPATHIPHGFNDGHGQQIALDGVPRLRRFIQEMVGKVLGLAPDQVPLQRGFFDLGMTSLLAVELRNRLQADLQVERVLPTTVFLDYPNVETLAGYLAGRQTANASPLSANPRQTAKGEPIAIIGMSCRFPGAATLEDFWRLLRDGVDAIQEVPADRWDKDAYYDPESEAVGKMCTRHGGFLSHVDRFDAEFFGIAPREAIGIDPQHRLLLEVGWEALENAAQAPGQLMGSRTGVFVGISTNDYGDLLAAGGAGHIDAYFGTGRAPSAAAGRLAYGLGLQGPALVIDTACSSSLVAIHQACQSLRAGECLMALAGGVNLILNPFLNVSLSHARMLAPDGHCKTFDASADGYVRGEGCGMIVLKRLSDAEDNGDHVLAVIRGSAVNQDGRSGGLTVPNGPAQEAVIRAALDQAGIEPHAVDYVEAHGTGTPLGDPIEVQALAAVLGERRPSERPLLMGSVKTNIGHLEAAAGVAGLIKVVLALEHGEIPPHLHFQAPNPLIPWKQLPVKVTRDRTPWPTGCRRRIAGVSSFGFIGTNAHLVLEDAAPSPRRNGASVAPERTMHVLALSAKNPAALRELSARYVRWFTEHPDVSMADVCFTANTGRTHFDHRVAIVASSVAEARAKAERVVKGDGDELPQGLNGERSNGLPTVAELARLYESGGRPDFVAFDKPWPRQKLPLPTYPFQRQRYWLQHHATGSPLPHDRPIHPLLGARVRAAGSAQHRFERQLAAASPAWLGDHRIYGEVVFPAAGYLELALAALEYASLPRAAVNRLFIREPLVFPAGKPRWLQTVLTVSELGQSTLEFFSQVEGEESWTLHAVATADSHLIRKQRPQVDLAALRARCDRKRNPSEMYRSLAKAGLQFGPAFQSMEQIQLGSNEVLTRVVLPPPLTEQDDSYQVHPSLLDGCIQSVAALLPAKAPTFLPFHVEQFFVEGSVGQAVWCHGVLRAGSHGQYVTDVALLSDSGEVLAQLIGLTLRRASQAALLRGVSSRAAAELLYEISWQELDRPARSPDRTAGLWLIFKDAGALGEALAGRLSAHGQRCVLVDPRAAFSRSSPDRFTVAPGEPEHFDQLLAETLMGESVPLRGIAYLWGLDLPSSPNSTELATQIPRLLGGALHLVQALLRRGQENLDGLWLLTRGAVAAEALAPVANLPAALWGLGRTIAAEHPQLFCTLLDLDPEIPAAASVADDVAVALLSGTEEPEQSWRGSRRLAPRLRRLDSSDRLRVPEGEFALGIEQKGKLDSFRFESIDGLPPGPGQVKVRVQAAGLNFRDVLNALDLYPGEPGPLGGEFAGEVLAVGENVGGLAPGDEVFGFAAGAFATTVTAPAALMVKKPDALNTIEAASLPIAFTTAQLAFERAQLGSGQRVLIHAGAGGVGLAAIQLAQRLGAEVFATASPGKHSFLRSQGVQFLFDSRTVEFAAQILQATNGRGVDVVLNSLSGGDFIHRTLSTLATGGCFVEIGKRNVWTTDAMARLRPDVRYHLLALDELLASAPPTVSLVLRDLAARFERGELRPSRNIAYPLVEAPAAFRSMQRGLHVGKLVLRVPPPSVLRDDATYLITGGLGALGLATAEWLVKRGARHLLLTGRRPPDDSAQESIRQMQAVGCEILVVLADVSNADEVQRVLQRIDRSMPQLRGVIHAAGVLEDGVLAQQSWTRFVAVLSPKVWGACHLHEQTLDRTLDFFVLYSSVASVFGGPGQGAYAAANAFLDALAQQRRRIGLAALSVNWGPWGGRGMAVRDEVRPHRAQAQGISLLDGDTALAALNELLRGDLGQATVLKVEWSRYRDAADGQRLPPALKGLLERSRGETSAVSPVLERLRATAPAEQEELLIAHVQREVQKVLGLATVPDPKRGFFDMGMDSLMTIDLRNRLHGQFGERTELSSTLAFDYPTVNALAAYLARTVIPDCAPHDAIEEPSAPTGSLAELAAELQQLPVEELTSLLNAEILDVLGEEGNA